MDKVLGPNGNPHMIATVTTTFEPHRAQSQIGYGMMMMMMMMGGDDVIGEISSAAREVSIILEEHFIKTPDIIVSTGCRIIGSVTAQILSPGIPCGTAHWEERTVPS